MKRPDVPQAGSSPVTGLSDAKMTGPYPRLCEFLTDTRWDDGTARTPSTVTMFVEDGLVKMALNDRDLERSLYRSGDTLQEAFRALEKALAQDSADWRNWKSKKKK